MGTREEGKKCKEKFENLYKYYKKIKDGKAGRQDGKHDRFFRQLEAVCGESSSTTTTNNITTTSANYYQPPLMTFTSDGEKVLHHNNNNINKYCSSKSLSLSNNSSSDHQFEISWSENNDDDDIIKDMSAMTYIMIKKQKQVEMEQKRDKRKSLRVEVEEIVECHMKKMIESQEDWMEKMMSVVEHREQEIVCKEEERMRDSIRFDDQQVHQLWAKERAWVATRDTALLEVVKKHLGKELITTGHHHHQPMVVEEYEEEPQNKNSMVGGENWRSISNLK